MNNMVRKCVVNKRGSTSLNFLCWKTHRQLSVSVKVQIRPNWKCPIALWRSKIGPMFMRHFQLGMIIPEDYTSLMMKAARASETSVDNYFTRQYIPEDNSEFLPTVYKNTYTLTNFCSFQNEIYLRMKQCVNIYLRLVISNLGRV
jgi:hypothetical protein